MTGLLPPRDVPAARLFRLLLGRPRPVLPLAFRLPFAPAVALSVRGITPLEDAEALDVDDAAPLPTELRHSFVTRRTIATVLLADGRPAVRDAADLGAMTGHELSALSAAVLRAVVVVSPCDRFIDAPAWRARLTEGAKHPSNYGAALSVAMSVNIDSNPAGIVRRPAPDRYFGLPLADITDGQMLAYEAGRAAFERRA